MKKLGKKEQFLAAMKNWDHKAEAYNEMTNLCASRPEHIKFHDWVKQTEWTLDAIIAFFRYQALQFNGEIDWPEFENDWYYFKAKIYACFE